ncbi:MAG: hypothetical protein GXP31_01210 [Kiritimatiellaeota bacterium]|nr:hypothetical protein [Kiritimatiellota bacterium]
MGAVFVQRMGPAAPGLRAVFRTVWCVAVLAVRQAPAATPADGGSSGMRVLLETGFEGGLGGWRRRGPAEFAVDVGKSHSGAQSARVNVGEGVGLEYQQLYREFDGVRGGDVFDAVAWVRTAGLQGGSAAYLYVEFLADGKRVGIVHSRVDPGTGAGRWEALRVTAASAPRGADAVRLGLVLHAHGTAWFDDVRLVRIARIRQDFAGGPRIVEIDSSTVVHPAFGGVGFHVFYHLHSMSEELFQTVIAKRWLELDPAFARVTHLASWDRPALDLVAARLAPLQKTRAEIYVTTWGPEDAPAGPKRRAYVRKVADQLEYLIREKGLTNITTYCMTNELSLGGWGKLRSDLPKFRDYHRLFFEEFKSRGLPVKLLATDASPVGSWHTIEWAAEHMDGITGVYGGHHYFNGHPPDDLTFYPWFLGRCRWGAAIARRKGKNFILGEFGCAQDGRVIRGVKMDACRYWGTVLEPLVGIQLCEAAIAAVNAGVYALGNWTFADFPDEYRKTYRNKWGVFKWSGGDHAVRPHYYAYGLMTRFFRGPATVFAVRANDPLVRVAALQRSENGAWSIAAVNRNRRAVTVRFRFAETDRRPETLRKYVFDPARPPTESYGDLQGPAARLAVGTKGFEDELPAGGLAVYTNDVDDVPPPAVAGLRVGPFANGVRRLTWVPSKAGDVASYRIFRGTKPGFAVSAASRIGSTAAAEFADHGAAEGDRFHYAVVAVDHSGNMGPPARR